MVFLIHTRLLNLLIPKYFHQNELVILYRYTYKKRPAAKAVAKLTHTFSSSHVEGAVLLYGAVSLLHQLNTRAALLLYFWHNQQQTCAQLHALPTGRTARTPVAPVCHRTHRVCLGVKCTIIQDTFLKERHDRLLMSTYSRIALTALVMIPQH